MKYRNKKLSAKGIVSNYSLRTAKSGNLAHEFNIGSQQYSLFTSEEPISFRDGDLIGFEYSELRLQSGSRREYLRVLPESVELLLPNASGRLGGFVYVLSNPSMAGVLKIGFTTGTPEERALELSAATGVPTKFKVEWAQAVTCDPKIVEQRVHAQLRRKKAGKEFFKVTVEEAQSAILDAYYMCEPTARETFDEVVKERNESFLLQREAFLVEQGRIKAAKEVEAFWKSPVARWLTHGTVQIVLSRFKAGVERSYPTLLGGMFGKAVTPWMEIGVYGRSNYPGETWRVHIRGVHNNKKIGVSKDCASMKDAANLVLGACKLHPCENSEFKINISTALMPTPNCYDHSILGGHETVELQPELVEIADVEDGAAFHDLAARFKERR